jgi:DNA-binding HxlR family transcriptional regulator
MLHLYNKGETRRAQLSKLTTSRGTLSLILRELEQEALIQRRVIDTKPIQSLYSLTPKGAAIAKQLKEIEQIMQASDTSKKRQA